MEEQRPQKVRYNKAGTSVTRQDKALEDKMKHNKLRTGETCSNKTTGHVTKHAKTNGRLVLGGEMRTTQPKKDEILVKIRCFLGFLSQSENIIFLSQDKTLEFKNKNK